MVTRSPRPTRRREDGGSSRPTTSRWIRDDSAHPDAGTSDAHRQWRRDRSGPGRLGLRPAARERIIFLGQPVDDDIANPICAQMLLLAAEDPDKDIYLYINSPGGSVTAGMAIYDTMQFVKNDVATVAMGLAASMGQFLLSAGTAGKRYALPQRRILMHQPSAGLGGTASDIKIQAEQMLLHQEARWPSSSPSTPARPSRRSRQRLRPRPLVHRRGGQGLRLRRPRRAQRPASRRRRHRR